MRKYEDMSLFELMRAIELAAIKNSAEDVKAISDIAKTVIEKCDVQQLSVGLSEKRIDGDLAGTTGLNCLMDALAWATYKNSAGNVKAISDIAKTVIDKCDAQQLSVGLSEKIIGGDSAGETGLNCLMNALTWAASENSEQNVKVISDIAMTVIEKCDAQQLSFGLSEKITGGGNAGTTGLYFLMVALNNAAFKNSAENVKAITDIAKTVIDKCDPAQLSGGLSEKKINGDSAGTTGLYCLMLALDQAASKNSAENVKAISDIAKTMIDKCNAAQLSVGLSEKRIGGDSAGATGLYFLMRALDNAVSKNSAENVKAISDIAKTMIDKCNAAQLSVGLSEKRIGGDLAGATGLYFLMLALNNAAFKNSEQNVKAISNIAKRVIDKCDVQQLSVGLSEKRIGGDSAGATGLYCLMLALNNAADKKSQENIKIIADLIIQISTRLDSNQIPDEQKQLIFSGKENLSKPLKKYLKNKAQTMPIKEFEEMCSSQKLLGALIDHHSSILGGKGKTATRVFVDELHKKNPEVIAQAILDEFSKGKIVLSDADSLINIVQREVKNRLSADELQYKDAAHQLVLEVLKTDIIQKQLLLKREEFLKNIAQAILNKFLESKISLPDADSLTAIVQMEVKEQLGPEKSKDENAVDQFTLAVLRTDIIQKELLPEREKKAEQSAALSQGPGLFTGPSAEKKFRTVAATEVDERMVSRNAPAIHVRPSDNALWYAKIFHDEAIKLHGEHKNRFHETKDEIEKLALWKQLLHPNEMATVKNAARQEWNKLMSKNADRDKAALEIDQLLSTVVVPKNKIMPPISESDLEDILGEKPKPLGN